MRASTMMMALLVLMVGMSTGRRLPARRYARIDKEMSGGRIVTKIVTNRGVILAITH